MNDPASEKNVKKIGSAGVKEKLCILKQGFAYNTINQGIATGTNNCLTKVIDQKRHVVVNLLNGKKK